MASDLTEALLPSGVRVRGHLPTLGTLLRRNLLPRDLLAVALKAANPAWLTASRALDPDKDGEDAQAYLAVLVSAFPRQRQEPGGEWQPWTLTPDDLTNDSVDELDIDSLENLVLRLVSADELTAASASLLGMDAPDDGEATAGIAGWAGFRGGSGGGAPDPDGEALGDEAVPAAAAGG